MIMKWINDPVYGLPLQITLFDDGSFTYTHAVTGLLMHGFYDCLRDTYTFAGKNTIEQSISASDAANMLQVSKVRISQLCDEGKLSSAFIGSSLFISLSDVIAYRDSDRTPGRKQTK